MSEEKNDVKDPLDAPAAPESPKHKKAISEPVDEKVLIETLSALAKTIKVLDHKQQHILNDWLEVWGQYLAFEKTFEPQRLMYYKRGEVVYAHLGYNVGSEQGGVRYCIVVENNNNKTDNIVMVVPIASLEAGKTKDDLHRSEVFLGKLIDGVSSYAMPLQMRPISKLRIIKPKYKGQEIVKVSGDLLDKIDEQIRINFTKWETDT